MPGFHALFLVVFHPYHLELPMCQSCHAFDRAGAEKLENSMNCISCREFSQPLFHKSIRFSSRAKRQPRFSGFHCQLCLTFCSQPLKRHEAYQSHVVKAPAHQPPSATIASLNAELASQHFSTHRTLKISRSMIISHIGFEEKTSNIEIH